MRKSSLSPVRRSRFAFAKRSGEARERSVLFVRPTAWLLAIALVLTPAVARAEGTWEITPKSQAALDRGMEWLAKNQGKEGNWGQKELALVSMGLLAYLSAGHLPDRGKYGDNARRALDYVVNHAKPSGLLNTAVKGQDMYNHGLSTFVLGQAYGMTGDRKVGRTLDRALRLIQDSQCADGGWDYTAVSKPKGHDISLSVMQAKALRSAMDSGFKVDPDVINKAVAYVRRCYRPHGGRNLAEWKKHPGVFTYQPGFKPGTVMTTTTIGVVCLQEFGQYDDWRIDSSMRYIRGVVEKGRQQFIHQYQGAIGRGVRLPPNHVPFDSYTLYYLGQVLYQRGEDWKVCYPILRDELVKRQTIDPKDPKQNGCWTNYYWWMRGKQAQFFGTAIGCFYLSIPNRYLPILQEGRIESLIHPVESGRRGKKR